VSVVAMWYSILQRFRATAAMGVAWAAPHRTAPRRSIAENLGGLRYPSHRGRTFRHLTTGPEGEQFNVPLVRGRYGCLVSTGTSPRFGRRRRAVSRCRSLLLRTIAVAHHATKPDRAELTRRGAGGIRRPGTTALTPITVTRVAAVAKTRDHSSRRPWFVEGTDRRPESRANATSLHAALWNHRDRPMALEREANLR